ncbi:hypothetical protein HDA40_007614 [Hamadaea flava]|uniref:DUF3618 domain-containing protein n=1 Tax=Hamadaea flava TaxID=1742688 RepID=A0ABV8LXE0_9ACTN|nr:hypothetical protein [Hamadaea flava]MCP2329107.1 hypothetical protein [Hamadaea flava]
MFTRRQDRTAEWWNSLSDALSDARDSAADRAHDVGGKFDDATSEAQRRAVRAWAALSGKPVRPAWPVIAAAVGAGVALGWLGAQAYRRPQIRRALASAEETAQERMQDLTMAAGERARQLKASSNSLLDKAQGRMS